MQALIDAAVKAIIENAVPMAVGGLLALLPGMVRFALRAAKAAAAKTPNKHDDKAVAEAEKVLKDRGVI